MGSSSSQPDLHELETQLAQLLYDYGSTNVLDVISDLAWDQCQAGLAQSGRWRRIFIALQEVVAADRYESA